MLLSLLTRASPPPPLSVLAFLPDSGHALLPTDLVLVWGVLALCRGSRRGQKLLGDHRGSGAAAAASPALGRHRASGEPHCSPTAATLRGGLGAGERGL